MTEDAAKSEANEIIRINRHDLLREQSISGEIHDVHKGESSPEDFSIALVQQIMKKEGVEETLQPYFKNPEHLKDILAAVYISQEAGKHFPITYKLTDPENKTRPFETTIIPNQAKAADAGATWAALHQGDKSLSDEFRQIVNDFLEREFDRTIPEDSPFPLPEVNDSRKQLLECYGQEKGTENKAACALAGAEEMLKALGATAETGTPPRKVKKTGGVDITR